MLCADYLVGGCLSLRLQQRFPSYIVYRVDFILLGARRLPFCDLICASTSSDFIYALLYIVRFFRLFRRASATTVSRAYRIGRLVVAKATTLIAASFIHLPCGLRARYSSPFILARACYSAFSLSPQSLFHSRIRFSKSTYGTEHRPTPTPRDISN